MLDGRISVQVGEEVVRAGEGDFLWAPPRDVAHAFCLESDRARMCPVVHMWS